MMTTMLRSPKYFLCVLALFGVLTKTVVPVLGSEGSSSISASNLQEHRFLRVRVCKGLRGRQRGLCQSLNKKRCTQDCSRRYCTRKLARVEGFPDWLPGSCLALIASPVPSAAPSPSPSAPPSLSPSAPPSPKPIDDMEAESPSNIPPSIPICDPVNSFLVFTGHDAVRSYTKESVDVRWSPAFVYEVTDGEYGRFFISCGKVTFNVIIAKGEVTFDRTSSLVDLREMAMNNPDMEVLMTQDTSITKAGLVAGETYSVLVLAATSFGHESFNRQAALVKVSTTDLKLKESFTQHSQREMPKPSNESNWEVDINGITNETQVGAAVDLVVTGDYPDEFGEIEVDDFVYVYYGQDLELKLVRPRVLTETSSNFLHWKCTLSGLEEILEEADISFELSDGFADEDKNIDSDREGFDNATIQAELLALPDQVKTDLCLVVFGVTENCVDVIFGDQTERELGWIRDAVNDAVDYVADSEAGQTISKGYQAVKDLGEDVYEWGKDKLEKLGEALDKLIDALKDGKTFDEQITFLDFSNAVEFTCGTDGSYGAINFQAAFKLGLQFDVTAKARFYVTASLTDGIKQVGIELFGEFALKSYAMLGATIQAEFSNTWTLYTNSKTHKFTIPPLVIIVTNKPTLRSVIAASASVEAEALVTASLGYRYEFKFEYNSGGFVTSADFTQLEPIDKKSEFSLRVRAEAEVALQLTWEVIFYGIYKATLAADMGTTSEIEVGTNTEAIAVAPPFYTLNTFYVGAYINVRMEFGFNNILSDLFDYLRPKQPEAKRCGFEFLGESSVFNVPSLVKETIYGDAVPQKYQDAITEIVTSNNPLATAATVSLGLLLDEVPQVDEFFDDAEEFIELVDQFTSIFDAEIVMYEDEFPILSLPEDIQINYEGVETCVGDYAIVLEFSASREGLSDGHWYANFDGKVLSTDTLSWEIGSPTDLDSVKLRLPRDTTDPYKLNDGAVLYLRATSALFSYPKDALFAELGLSGFSEANAFECCEDEDCYKQRSALELIPNYTEFVCVNRFCQIRRIPGASQSPSFEPSTSQMPSVSPSRSPSHSPSLSPSVVPSKQPSLSPTDVPSMAPTDVPSMVPSLLPSIAPTTSIKPSHVPSSSPSRRCDGIVLDMKWYDRTTSPVEEGSIAEGTFTSEQQLVAKAEVDLDMDDLTWDDINFIEIIVRLESGPIQVRSVFRQVDQWTPPSDYPWLEITEWFPFPPTEKVDGTPFPTGRYSIRIIIIGDTEEELGGCSVEYDYVIV